MIAVGIGDSQSGKRARLIDGDLGPGVLAYTAPAAVKSATFKPFLNATYGASMAQNIAFSGTPDRVHDGLDTTLWTASDITGSGFDFNNTGEITAHTGADVIKSESLGLGAVMQIAKGSTIALTDFTALTLAIYVERRWEAGDSVTVYAWDTGAGTRVGNAVPLEDYFNFGTFDEWHEVVIPIGDLGAGDFDAIRIENAANQGQTPHYYLDEIIFEETGGVESYDVSVAHDTIFEAHYMRCQVEATLALTAVDPNLFFGVTLSDGIIFSRTSGDGSGFASTFNNILDMQWVGFLQDSTPFSNGTNSTWVLNSYFSTPLIIDPTTDRARITISDNLSALGSLRFSLGGVEYPRDMA